MLGFFKRLFVRFVTRKIHLVSNKSTQEYFIVSNVSRDGYVVLLTQYDTSLPTQYKVFKDHFVKATTVVNANFDEDFITGIQDNKILLLSGNTIKLIDINENIAEDCIDTSF